MIMKKKLIRNYDKIREKKKFHDKFTQKKSSSKFVDRAYSSQSHVHTVVSSTFGLSN